MGRILWGSVMLVILGICKCEEVTVTTAITRPNTSPMPSTDLRRSEVKLRSHAHKSKKPTYKLAWNWDFYCKLQSVKGNCTQYLLRYHYNSALNKCMAFTYTGCHGNKNNFETLLDCERYCKGANFMDDEQSMFEMPFFCYLQPDPGTCLALFTKYYYDVGEGRCKSFMYGGCAGNSNRFDTLAQCSDRCSYVNYQKLIKYVE